MLRSTTHAVACSGDTIAVSVFSADAQILLFQSASGALLRSFGVRGRAVGQLNGCGGLRFTPDGARLLIAEESNRRVSMFTVTGEWVCCIGAGQLSRPTDVEIAPNGDIVVIDSDNHRVCMFVGEGGVLKGTCGGPGVLHNPWAAAVCNRQLFTVDYTAAVVHVFE